MQIVRAYRRASLDKELAHGRTVVHGVEGGNLVDAHGWHFEDTSDLVHDADGGEAVLALAKVQNRHHGGLLVLRRVALEQLGDDGLILRREFEGDVGVVVGSVAVLEADGLALLFAYGRLMVCRDVNSHSAQSDSSL